MAEVPCDICGSQDHDYSHCQAGALPESQTPGILQSGRADNQGSLREGPCGWCEKRGHISLECPAKFYSKSMKERFPKGEKRRKSKILEYTCRRCGEQHPFNWYCPYAVKPPIVPGECRSCATLTNHHDEECELVAKRIGSVCVPFVGISRTCMQIAQIDIQIGGPKRYCPARRVWAVQPVF